MLTQEPRLGSEVFNMNVWELKSLISVPGNQVLTYRLGAKVIIT